MVHILSKEQISHIHNGDPNESVPVLYNHMAPRKRCAAYCKIHLKFLTGKHIKNHRCLMKQCRGLVRIKGNSFWARRREISDAKKLRKRLIREEIERLYTIMGKKK